MEGDDLAVAKAVLVRLRRRIECACGHPSANDVFETVVALVRTTRPEHFAHACMSVFALAAADGEICSMLGDERVRELLDMAVGGVERLEAVGKRRRRRWTCCF